MCGGIWELESFPLLLVVVSFDCEDTYLVIYAVKSHNTSISTGTCAAVNQFIVGSVVESWQ